MVDEPKGHHAVDLGKPKRGTDPGNWGGKRFSLEDKAVFWAWKKEHPTAGSYQWGIEHGVSDNTMSKWNKEFKEHPEGLRDIDQFIANVTEQALADNAPVKILELYARLKGLLDKKEDTGPPKVTADDIIREWPKAEGELKAAGYVFPSERMVKMLHEPVLLLENVCEDTGQGHDADGSLSDVALSGAGA